MIDRDMSANEMAIDRKLGMACSIINRYGKWYVYYSHTTSDEINFMQCEPPIFDAAQQSDKLTTAMSALDRMTAQRDRLAQQLKDATEQLARAGDLLCDSLRYIRDHSSRTSQFELVLHDNIESFMKGEVLPPKAP